MQNLLRKLIKNLSNRNNEHNEKRDLRKLKGETFYSFGVVDYLSAEENPCFTYTKYHYDFGREFKDVLFFSPYTPKLLVLCVNNLSEEAILDFQKNLNKFDKICQLLIDTKQPDEQWYKAIKYCSYYIKTFEKQKKNKKDIF